MKRIVLLTIVAIFMPHAAYAQMVWDVKAIYPENTLLSVKAVDKRGNRYDIKAFEKGKSDGTMDIKASVHGQQLPVKLLKSDKPYAPLGAINKDGSVLDIKAIMPDGTLLDVMGVGSDGKITHIKAVAPYGQFYDIKAIQIHDVKGIQIYGEETSINGVPIQADVKALPRK